jgi:PhoH-like ATPase
MFKNVYCNEFLILEDGTKLRVTKKISSHKINARTFDVSAFKGTVRPRNIEQEFALELLMDPDVTAVSLAGLAGSGKTYLALAAAFHQTMEKRIYKRVVVTRSPVDSDEAIGFLPGDEEEKMSPWLGGITDNLESFVCPDSKDRNESELTGSIAFIKQKMNLQIKSLNLMKGRSFEDTLIIVDEVQDITRKTLKMISTRVGKGSKIIFLGNVAQIDNSFLTENTCGMSVLIRTFADSGLVGHVTLQQGERSSFATLAEERL